MGEVPRRSQPSPEPGQNDASAGSLMTTESDTAAIDEETTEAVLSYLYEHLGSEDPTGNAETGRLDIPSSVDA